MKTGFIR